MNDIKPCPGFAPHIVLREAGLSAEMVRVDFETKTLPTIGQSYLPINPMGKVPALELDDGAVLVADTRASTFPPGRQSSATWNRPRNAPPFAPRYWPKA